MKDTKDRRKNIRIIGVLVILGMLLMVAYAPTGIAYDWTEDNRQSHRIIIDYDDAPSPYEDEEAFAIVHDDDKKVLFWVQEDGGRVSIGESEPDFKLEVVGSSDDGYFGVSSAADNDGDIFIIHSTGLVGIGTTLPGKALEINSATGKNLRLTYDDDETVDFETDSSGNLIIIPTGYGVGISTTPVSKLSVAGGVNIGTPLWASTYSAPSWGLIVEGNVGIGSNSPGAKLDVEVTNGGAATIGASGNSASANYAIAMGHGTTASGAASTAIGYYTEATNSHSFATGMLTDATGFTSTAMGYYSVASASYSTAIGYYTTAGGLGSIAMGYDTTASGEFSTAMGRLITVSGTNSFGIGLGSGGTITQSNTMAIMGGKVGIGTVSPSVEFEVSGDAKISGTLHADGDVVFGAGPNPLYIDMYDAITVTHSYHTVTLSSGTSANLETIEGGDIAGQILILTAASGKTITVLDGDDNIQLYVDRILDSPQDTLTLIYDDGTEDWFEISYSNND